MTMTDAPKARTLRDYAHFLKRNLWVIGGTVVIVVGVGVALGLSQPKRYSASATLYFPDPLAQAGIVGEQASNTPQAQLSAQGVARLTSASTLTAVKSSLATRLSTSQIKSDISAVTDPNTFVVTVTATAPSAALAANLANTVVHQAKAEADAASAQQFGAVAKRFLGQVKALTAAQRSNPAIVSGLYDNYSRADALSHGGAVAAQIQSNASVPTAPSSPKPVADGVVGGVLGLALGLLIAGVREAFDRRLRGPRAIESDLNLPIVGQLREEALGRSPSPSNGKPRIDELDLEAFRILRTNIELLTSDKPMRIVAVTSALPEEGKTTVASSLAFTFALAGRRTLLVECDLRRPTLSKRLGIARSPGLTDFLEGAAKPQDVVQAVGITLGRNGASSETMASPNGSREGSGVQRSAGNLACIAAGARTERATEMLASAQFRQFLDEVTEVYDAVVLDTAPLLPVADTLQVLPNVDAVIMCLRASRTTRDQAIAARTALSRLPERPTGVVLTGARDPHDYSGYYSYAYHAYGDQGPEAPTPPEDPPAAQVTHNSRMASSSPPSAK
jgi:non-specific protein-tyrosine kinase